VYCLPSSQYPLATVLAFDDHNNGYPVAFVIASNSTAATMETWLRALNETALQKDPNWRPSCFITDCDDAEIKAIQ